MTLTEKERSLLKDMKDSEQLCIDKYEKGAEAACDGQLKNLFSTLVTHERTHLDTLTRIEGTGTAPAMSAGGTAAPEMTFTATYMQGDTSENAKNDAYLCTDALSGEKQVTSLYNTCVFEFRDASIRTALSHIQAEEQNHGKMLYDYMAANGMY